MSSMQNLRRMNDDPILQSAWLISIILSTKGEIVEKNSERELESARTWVINPSIKQESIVSSTGVRASFHFYLGGGGPPKNRAITVNTFPDLIV